VLRLHSCLWGVAGERRKEIFIPSRRSGFVTYFWGLLPMLLQDERTPEPDKSAVLLASMPVSGSGVAGSFDEVRPVGTWGENSRPSAESHSGLLQLDETALIAIRESGVDDGGTWQLPLGLLGDQADRFVDDEPRLPRVVDGFWSVPERSFEDRRLVRTSRRPEDVSRRIDNYRPQGATDEEWVAIGDLVREVAKAATLAISYDEDLILAVVTRLAAWSWSRAVPITIEAIFRPERIEVCCTRGMADVSNQTQGNYRSILRAVAEVVVGPPLFPGRPNPLAKSSTNPPYSGAEVAELLSWSGSRATWASRDNLRTVLALGLGAGLRPAETNVLVASDIDVSLDGLLITVPGIHTRKVWVERIWEDALLARMDQVGDRPLFRPDRLHPKTDDVGSYIDRQRRRPEVVRLSARRCRTTWIVRHLERATSPLVVAQAAGIRPDQIGQYLEFLTKVDGDIARLMLRGDW
jgi:hypothetical protein